MLAEIEKRLMLGSISDFTMAECEDRLLLLRYLLRREDLQVDKEELTIYETQIEERLAFLKANELSE